jgi:acyl carrier protein
MQIVEQVTTILAESLNLDDQVRGLTESSRLLGSLPEFDSMAVVTVISALEQHFGFIVNDDEISADTFATVGSLCEFVGKKLNSPA